MVVSIHTPTQGVTCFCHQTKATSACFNPHTHAGCDCSVIIKQQVIIVSIHTPTQGVTIGNTCPTGCGQVSIHTPTQGVTFCRARHIFIHLNVSIHTPTQGVTISTTGANLPSLVSIHTPTQGVTPNDCLGLFSMSFQSTHPRRV